MPVDSRVWFSLLWRQENEERRGKAQGFKAWIQHPSQHTPPTAILHPGPCSCWQQLKRVPRAPGQRSNLQKQDSLGIQWPSSLRYGRRLAGLRERFPADGTRIHSEILEPVQMQKEESLAIHNNPKMLPPKAWEKMKFVQLCPTL